MTAGTEGDPAPTVAPRRKRLARTVAKRFYAAVPFKPWLVRALRAVIRKPPPFYRHLYFSGPFRVAVAPGKSFRMYHYDRATFETEFFWRGFPYGWEAVSLDIWTALCGSCREIWDVGANTGLYSLTARCVNPAARVTAFEPHPLVFDRLTKNLALNGYSNVRANRLALGSRECNLFLESSGEDEDTEAHVRETAAPSTGRVSFPVQVVAGDTYRPREGIDRVDLIKIDVEGHEGEVLQGLRECLGRWRPTILLEVLTDERGRDVERLVSDYGYLYFNVNDDPRNGRLAVRRVDRITRSDCLNFLLCSATTAERIDIARWY